MERTLPTFDTHSRILISSSPDPKSSERYLSNFQHTQPESYERLSATASGLQYLIAVFSYSRFLSEAVLQNPDWLESLVNSPELERVLSADDYKLRLESCLGQEDGIPPARLFAVFRRRQLLRIFLRDVMGHASLPEIVEDVSNLADAILDVAYRRIRASLEQRYGTPSCTDSQGGNHPCGMSVIALGKLGGRELNYSSDIDLMFVYSGNGATDGHDEHKQ